MTCTSRKDPRACGRCLGIILDLRHFSEACESLSDPGVDVGFFGFFWTGWWTPREALAGKVRGGETIAERSSVVQLIDPKCIMGRPMRSGVADIPRSRYKSDLLAHRVIAVRSLGDAVPETNAKSLLTRFPWKSFEVVVNYFQGSMNGLRLPDA